MPRNLLILFIVLIATLASQAAHSATPEQRMAHISIVSKGRGDPVVLIPGLASPRSVWDGIAPDLAKDHRVILVQVNGFAGDDPGANLDRGVLEGIVNDLSDYLKANEADPVSLIGHSMGGLASLMFARDHPAQVKQIMIVDALPYFPALFANGGPIPPREQVDAVAKMMRDRVAARFGKPVDPASLKADVDGLAVKEESRAQMLQWAAQADPRVAAQLLYEDMSTDLRPALASIGTPLTVVVPWTQKSFGKDRTLGFYRKQYGEAPNVRFAPIAEAGHFVMLDQPTGFAAAVDSFLAN